MLIDSDTRLECLRLCKPKMFFIPAQQLLFITLNEIESAGAVQNAEINLFQLKEELLAGCPNSVRHRLNRNML